MFSESESIFTKCVNIKELVDRAAEPVRNRFKPKRQVPPDHYNREYQNVELMSD